MQSEKDHIIKISDQLYKASNSIRILRNINWPSSVREEFFRHKGQKMPVVSYQQLDPTETLHEIEKARKLIPDSSRFKNWATGIADKLENSAYLLANIGTCLLYTSPSPRDRG